MKNTDNIEITRFEVGSIATNMYLVSNGTDGVIIDPGFEQGETDNLINKVKKKCTSIKAVLLTHGHYDHISGLPYLIQKIACDIYIHRADNDKLSDPGKSGAIHFFTETRSPIKANRFLNDGQILKLLGREFIIIHTPGHTKGSVSISLRKHLFCGDTLFRDGIGRTDFYDGDYNDEIESIKQKILTLPPETQILPGHGPSTTVRRESKYFLD